MTQLTADFEAGVASANIQTTDTGSANAWDAVTRAGSSTIVYDGTNKAHGSLAAKLTNVAGASCWLEWSTSMGSPTEHYGRVYFYMPSIPTSSMTVVQCIGPAGAVAFNIQVVATTGTVTVFYNTGSDTNVFSGGLSATTLYRLEYHCVHSATVGQVEAKIFAGDSTTATGTFSSTANKNTSTSGDKIRFGQVSAGGSGLSIWMDDIVAGATSFPGPVSSGVASDTAQPSGSAAPYLLVINN